MPRKARVFLLFVLCSVWKKVFMGIDESLSTPGVDPFRSEGRSRRSDGLRRRSVGANDPKTHGTLRDVPTKLLCLPRVHLGPRMAVPSRYVLSVCGIIFHGLDILSQPIFPACVAGFLLSSSKRLGKLLKDT